MTLLKLQLNSIMMSWKGPEYFVLLQTSVVITKEYNVMVNSKELTGTTEYLTLQTWCRINRCRYKCRYNRVRLYLNYVFFNQTLKGNETKCVTQILIYSTTLRNAVLYSSQKCIENPNQYAPNIMTVSLLLQKRVTSFLILYYL